MLVLVAVGVNERTGLFKIRSAPTKGLYRHMAATPGSKIALTGWNAYSRIDAVTGFESPYLARLYIDSDAWTNILEWDGDVASVSGMRDEYRALPFRLVPPRPQTLVIGPGGGSDVLFALAAGSEKVTAVEMNPLMLRFVRSFGGRAGNLYDHPQVEAVLSEGRTFVRRTDRSFDVILMGFVDSWAAVASGGLSLSENHLYTVEAFRDYLDHLTPDGQLLILRWDVDVPRLVSNAVALLGVEEAGQARGRSPGDARGRPRGPAADDLHAQEEALDRGRDGPDGRVARRASPSSSPGRHVDEPYASLFSGRTSFAEYVAQAKTRVDPVFDDRPFFFARAEAVGPAGSHEAGLPAGSSLPVLVLCALFLAFGKPKGERRGPLRRLGRLLREPRVGFIAVELALLQHLTLLLGHPIFTLSILLFTLLAFGGLGSMASGRASGSAPVCLGGRGPRRRLRVRPAAGGAGAPAAAARARGSPSPSWSWPPRLPDGHALPARPPVDGPRVVPGCRPSTGA